MTTVQIVATSTDVITGLGLGIVVGAALGVLVMLLVFRRMGEGTGGGVQSRSLALAEQEAQRSAVTSLVAPVTAALDRMAQELARAERERVATTSQLSEQVQATARGTNDLRTETGRLVNALRRSEVRGRWGEVELRRLVEAAGMLEHVHFTEQDTQHGTDGDPTVRPDLIVHLSDGRHVVVDAKVALSAYLDASTAADDVAQRAALVRHASDLQKHVDQLASKQYWARYDSPEFVVMFLPAESLLAAALDVLPGLLEHGFERNVIIATPTTLQALLRTVAYTWRQDAAARNASEIHALGRELHARLATMGTHLAKLGGSLDAAVDQFNRTMGSLESRVLVSARKLAALGVVDGTGDDSAGLPIPQPITAATRPPVAAELAASAQHQLVDLPEAATHDAAPEDDLRPAVPYR